MPYQNNNSRIVPDSMENVKLNPVSSPTNQEIKYQIDLTQAKKAAATADALIKLGQGVLDVDYIMDRKAQDDIIAAEHKTESEGGNKREWRDVSKNISGMAKFNPYNKEAFRSYQAQDIERAALLELATYPDLEKLDAAQYQKVKQTILNNMFEGFNQTGLSPRDYEKHINTFHTKLQGIEAKYISDHAEFDFKQLKIKETSNTALNLKMALMNITDENTKAAVFKQVLEDEIQHLDSETGIVSADTQAAIIMDSLKTYIAGNANQLDDAEILTAISDFKLADGKSLREIVPNYEITIRDLMVQAREVQYNQMKMEVAIKDFKQEQMIRDIITDFNKKFIDGKLHSDDEIQNYAKEMITKYNLDGTNSMKLFQDLANGRKLWTELADVPSDPRVMAELGKGVLLGTTSYEELSTAIDNGTLNWKDGLTLMQNLQTREQKIQNENDKKVDKHIKETVKDFLQGQHTQDSDIDAILLDPDDQNAFNDELTQLYSEYQQTKDYQKFNNDLASLKSSYKQAVKEVAQGKEVRQMAKGFEDLKGTPPISQAQWNKLDMNKSTQALRQIGIVHTPRMNWKDKGITIASMPQQHRKITVTDANGNTYVKDSRHTGYDLESPNIYMGLKLYPPMDGCEVVGVSRENQNNGMGNMVLLKCPNGKLIKYMHLQYADLPHLGAKVNKNTVIGHVGNTGSVHNKATGSLHVEFYDANHQWITAWQFVQK